MKLMGFKEYCENLNESKLDNKMLIEANAEQVQKIVKDKGEWTGKINNNELDKIVKMNLYAMAKSGGVYLIVDDPKNFNKY